jgi:hypothetical protein
MMEKDNRKSYYKNMIILMVGGIESERVLRYIYLIMKDIVKELRT